MAKELVLIDRDDLQAVMDNDRATKEQLDVLLDYANDTTGAGDTRIGDAIKSLADGYGQGGGSELDTFMVWYSDDNVNWIPMTKHPNWDKTIANTKAHEMVDRTIVNVNGTTPATSSTNHWYMPIYQALSYFNMFALTGANPGNYSLFGTMGNALVANGNNVGFESGTGPTKVCSLTTTVTASGDIIHTKTIKANTAETNFPVITKFGVCLPAASGAGNVLLLGYCDIPPFQLSATAKTFYIKITF